MTEQWRQRDGTYVAVTAMSDQHLRRACAMLERQAREKWREGLLHHVAAFANVSQATIDAYEAGQDWPADDPEDEELAHYYFPSYGVLVDEQYRRVATINAVLRMLNGGKV